MTAARTRRIALAVALAASAPLFALLLALGLAYGQKTRLYASERVGPIRLTESTTGRRRKRR